MAVVRTLIVRKGSSWNEVDKLMSHNEERQKTAIEWNAFQTTVVEPIVEALGAELPRIHGIKVIMWGRKL